MRLCDYPAEIAAIAPQVTIITRTSAATITSKPSQILQALETTTYDDI